VLLPFSGIWVVVPSRILVVWLFTTLIIEAFCFLIGDDRAEKAEQAKTRSEIARAKLPDRLILGQVQRVVAKTLKIDMEKVTEESHIYHDLDADSLAVVELTIDLEDEFGIKIPDDDVENLYTVRQIANYIEQELAATAA
jgi:acyl carrier protein